MQSSLHTWQEEHIFYPWERIPIVHLQDELGCCERHWTILLKHIARKMTVAGIPSNRAQMNCWLRIHLLLLLHFLLNLLFPFLLLLNSILINSFTIAYVHTLCFEDIYYPLLLTFAKSTPICPQISFYPLLQLTKSNLCYAHSHGCGAIYLPGTIPLKKTNFFPPAFINYQ